MKIVLNLVIGFILNFIILNIILLGILGKNLKILLIKKIKTNDMKWLNKILLSIFLLYFLIKYGINTIYLDNTVVDVKVEDLNFKVSGELINKIFDHFGSSAAFIVGAKIASTFLIKSKITFPSKILTSFGTGIGFSGGYQILNAGTGILKSKIISKLDNDNNLNLSVDKVEIITNAKEIITGDNLTKKILESFLPKFKEDFEYYKSLNDKDRYFNLYNKEIKISDSLDFKSKIISNLEKNNSKKLSEIFQDNDSINYLNQIINSPLESADLEKLNSINDVLFILNNNLIVNVVMLYLIFTLIFILTVKFIIVYNINLDFIKKYPLGKYIYFLLTKLINIWSLNNIFWIYFILICLFIFSCISIFGIYVCIVALK